MAAATALADRAEIVSDDVRACVLLDGGIVWRPQFRLEGDRWVTPLAECPWSNDELVAADATLPPFIRQLGGAFLALPFGGRAVPPGIDGWPETAAQPPLHGPTANDPWSLIKQDDRSVTIGLAFPELSPIDHVEQQISCTAAGKLQIIITVWATRKAAVAIGYHPIARLPLRPCDLEISLPFAQGYTMPVVLDQATTAPAQQFDALENVPRAGGGGQNLARLPLGATMEDLVSLSNTSGRADLTYHDEKYALTLVWDSAILPNCLLWIHDRAAAQSPWNSAFRGIGIEPSASMFDFAPFRTTPSTPMADYGHRSTVELTPDAPLSFTVTMSVRDAKAAGAATSKTPEARE